MGRHACPGSGAEKFIAEGVAVCVEVKSNLKGQWDEVTKTAQSLWPLRRSLGHSTGFAHSAIPLIAVGFRVGWRRIDTLEKKMLEMQLAGVLSLDPPVFITNDEWSQGLLRRHEGPDALWAFATTVLNYARGLQWTSTSPECYSLRSLVLLQNIVVRTEIRDTKFDALSFFGPLQLKKPHPVLEAIDKKSRALVGAMYDELSDDGLLTKHDDGMITIHSNELDASMARLLGKMPLMNIPLYIPPKTESK